MSKRLSSFGFKSGVLPKPRQVVAPFKTPLEIKNEERENVGFRDPELIPKSKKFEIAAHVPLKTRVPVESIIEKTIKSPNEESDRRPEWKKEAAKVRRVFLKESLLQFEKEALEEMQARSRREQWTEKQAKLKSDPATTQQSEAMTLTLPTIESFLTSKARPASKDKGTEELQSLVSGNEFIVPRTPAEQELLRTQRKANYKHKELSEAENRSKLFLELYQSTENYITTEEGLEQALNRAFSPAAQENRQIDSTLGRTSAAFSRGIIMGSSADADENSNINDNQTEFLTKSLFRDLYGVTANNKPGLPEVEDAISGVTTQNRKAFRELFNEKDEEQTSI